MDKEKIEQIRKFGFEVSFEDEIFFWDYFHPTISDPGGYVTAYMLDENRCAYM